LIGFSKSASVESVLTILVELYAGSGRQIGSEHIMKDVKAVKGAQDK
jgi:hypothetical protein